MPEVEAVVRLPEVEPAQLAAAVEAALQSHGDLRAKLEAGAAQSARDEPDDLATARWFQTLLELGYLVASADGFAEQESASLASLLQRITASAIDHEALEQNFRDLDRAVATHGRRERLARLAAELEEPQAATEAIVLVSTIAMADGTLSWPEHEVLVELGAHLELDASRIQEMVHGAAARVREGLG